jgi:hypothetical protein
VDDSLAQALNKTNRIKMYAGKLNFATDVWTSPNYKAFVALMVHLTQKGKPLCLVLDIVEVAEVRTHHN